jgi:hypothetical protein
LLAGYVVVTALACICTYARFIAPMLASAPAPLDLSVSHADVQALHARQASEYTDEAFNADFAATYKGAFSPV